MVRLVEELKAGSGILRLGTLVLLTGVIGVAVLTLRASLADDARASKCSPEGGIAERAAGPNSAAVLESSRNVACDQSSEEKTKSWLSDQMIAQLAPSASDPDANPRLMGILETRTGRVPVVRVNDATSEPCPRSLALPEVRVLAQEAIEDFEARGRRVGIVTVYCEESELRVRVTDDHPISN